ncbi:MAG TPA: biopolymer transporter ExbD [Burkholderiales bacterium]|nr:biopolymer transporter ExbD [Burkholderiales bacterium]
MAFSGFNDSGTQAPMSEINMIPLIDVMLVLLIIFMVTAPLITHSVRVDLPQAAVQATPEPPRTVTVSIDASGQFYWDEFKVGLTELSSLMRDASLEDPQPDVRLNADRVSQYQQIADVLAAAQHAGLRRVGFVIQPLQR